MEIQKYKAYDPNTQLECDVISFDYRLNELGLRPLNGEDIYYTRRPNIIVLEYGKDFIFPWEGRK